MTVKLTIQCLLVYATVAAYLAAFVTWLAGGTKSAWRVYAGGFALAAAGWVYRWAHVGHVPLQNMFEVLLFMGMAVFPLSAFCRRVLKVDGAGWDMLLGAVVLVPVGFVFDAAPRKLMPALQSPLFAPHVTAYLLGYAVMAKAAVQAVALLAGHEPPAAPGSVRRAPAADRLVRLGFPLLTAGLILGAVWGKQAWGDWWNWDPKELWSLASWLVYVGYFHFRRTFHDRYPRAGALIVLLGAVFIAITLLWVNLSRIFAGLHSYA